MNVDTKKWLEKNKRLHKELLNMYKDLMKFGEKHDIKFIAAYGTFLGAVRHGGFIPWDDDLDVFIDESDLQKLIDNKDKLPKKYAFESLIWNKRYPYTTIKLVNKDLKTNKKNKSIKGVSDGLLLDIFVMHRTECESKRIPMMYDQAYWKNSKFENDRKSISFLKNIYSALHIFIPRTSIQRRYFKFINKYSDKEGNMFFSNALNDPKSYQYNNYKKLKKYRFEDTFVWGPSNYEDSLIEMYGNDWKNPPEVIEDTIGDIDII